MANLKNLVGCYILKILIVFLVCLQGIHGQFLSILGSGNIDSKYFSLSVREADKEIIWQCNQEKKSAQTCVLVTLSASTT